MDLIEDFYTKEQLPEVRRIFSTNLSSSDAKLRLNQLTEQERELFREIVVANGEPFDYIKVYNFLQPLRVIDDLIYTNYDEVEMKSEKKYFHANPNTLIVPIKPLVLLPNQKAAFIYIFYTQVRKGKYKKNLLDELIKGGLRDIVKLILEYLNEKELIEVSKMTQRLKRVVDDSIPGIWRRQYGQEVENPKKNLTLISCEDLENISHRYYKDLAKRYKKILVYAKWNAVKKVEKFFKETMSGYQGPPLELVTAEGVKLALENGATDVLKFLLPLRYEYLENIDWFSVRLTFETVKVLIDYFLDNEYAYVMIDETQKYLTSIIRIAYTDGQFDILNYFLNKQVSIINTGHHKANDLLGAIKENKKDKYWKILKSGVNISLSGYSMIFHLKIVGRREKLKLSIDLREESFYYIAASIIKPEQYDELLALKTSPDYLKFAVRVHLFDFVKYLLTSTAGWKQDYVLNYSLISDIDQFARRKLKEIGFEKEVIKSMPFPEPEIVEVSLPHQSYEQTVENFKRQIARIQKEGSEEEGSEEE